jgi:nitroreductase
MMEAWMDVLQAIYERRAIRQFKPEAPSAQLIAEIIGDAVQAPNSINRQAWSFVVIQGRDRLAAYSQQAKVTALAALPKSGTSELRGFLQAADFDIFYDAPALVVVCATLDDPMVLQDCCLAAQTLMLAAHAKGLGTCWIGFAEGWLNAQETKQTLGIPFSHVAVAPIIIGYPREVPTPPGRRAPAITWIGEAAAVEAAAS